MSITDKHIIDAYIKMYQKKSDVNLTETTLTNPKHFEIADSWDHHSEVSDDTREKMQTALEGKEFVTFPLEQSNMHPDVIEHLENHGYTVSASNTDATKVIHPDNPERRKVVTQPIESVLNKTKAHPDIISAYAKYKSDLKQQGTKLHVVISTTPYAIAAASTGTPWDGVSCMNLVGGCNKSYLEDDSKHGTHVAYLVHGNDVNAFKHGEPDAPISRILVKPFETDTDSGKTDVIFRPEKKSYGQNNNTFHDAVFNWARNNYPGIPGKTYRKNRKLYDDGTREYHEYSDEEVDDIYNNLSSDNYQSGYHTHNFTTQQSDRIIKNLHDIPFEAGTEKYKKTLGFVKSAENLQPRHITNIMNVIKPLPHDESLQIMNSLAIRNGQNFNTKQIKAYRGILGEGVDANTYPNAILSSPALPDSDVDELLPMNLTKIRRSKLKKHHVQKILDDYKYTFDHVANLSDMIDKPMLNNLIDNHLKTIDNRENINRSSYVKSALVKLAVNHPEFTQEMHDKLLHYHKNTNHGRKDSSDYILSNSKFAKFSDANTDYGSDVTALAQNKNIPESEHIKIKDHFMYHYNGDNTSMRNSGILYMNSLPKHISDHMSDIDYRDLAGVNATLSFEDPHASNKHLDAIRDRLYNKYKNADWDEINQNFNNDESTDEDEKHMQDHSDVFHKYLNELKNHMYRHGIDNRDYEFHVHDTDEAYNVDKRLAALDRDMEDNPYLMDHDEHRKFSKKVSEAIDHAEYGDEW